MKTTESETAVKTKASASSTVDVVSDDVLDGLVGTMMADGVDLFGPQGVMADLGSRLASRMLAAELTHHLGYEHSDPTGRRSGNNRNGSYTKTVKTEAGELTVTVPRDRNGTFEPQLIGKHQRRLTGSMIWCCPCSRTGCRPAIFKPM